MNWGKKESTAVTQQEISRICILQTRYAKWYWYPSLGVADRFLRQQRKIDETLHLKLDDTEITVTQKILQREFKLMNKVKDAV